MTFRASRLLRRSQPQLSWYDRTIQWSLWLLLGLLPIFFLPFTSDPIEINKALLFYLLVLVALTTWFLKFVVRREGKFLRSPVDLWLTIFLVLSVAATIFSLYRYHSLVGATSFVADSLVSTIFFLAFFFLVVNTLKRSDLPRVLLILLFGSGIVVVFNFFQVFGTFLFPWDFSRIATFNAVVNSSLAFSVFLAIVGILCLVRLAHPTSSLQRIGLSFLAFLSLFLQLVYDHPVGWYVLIAGLLLFLVFANTAKRLSPRWLLLPTLIIGVSIVALFVSTQSLFQANIPQDITLPAKEGLSIAAQSIQHNPILGSGQGTYDAAFTQYRPISYNDLGVWNLRFVKSTNSWLHMVSTVGVLAVLSLAIATFLLLVRLAREAWRTAFDENEWSSTFSVFVGGVLIVVASFFTVFNFFLAFLFWLFLALGVVVLRPTKNQDERNLDRQTSTPFWASLGFSLLVVLSVVFLFFAGRFWVADLHVARASRLLVDEASLEGIRSNLSRAIELNPYEQGTYYELAQNLLTQAQLSAQEEAPDINSIRAYITATLSATQAGIQRYDRFSGSHEAASSLYRDVDSLTGATSPETLAAHQRAIELEPNNPLLFMNLGEYFLLLARAELQNNGEENVEPTAEALQKASEFFVQAKQAFESADALKKDYLAAKLNIALVLRLQEKGDEAVAMLKDLAATYAFNIDVLFNLAENYRLDGNTDEALGTLTDIVTIFPGHSDAHFRLAEIYEERGDVDQAIRELETVLRLNPESTEVAEKLRTLRGQQAP